MATTLYPLVLGLHLMSQHYPAEQWNDFNPGVYVRASDGLTAGAFYNSERRWSVYAGQTFDGPYGLSLTVGAISGYHQAPILPLVVPSINFPLAGAWKGRLAFGPKIQSHGASVIHLMIERPL